MSWCSTIDRLYVTGYFASFDICLIEINFLWGNGNEKIDNTELQYFELVITIRLRFSRTYKFIRTV